MEDYSSPSKTCLGGTRTEGGDEFKGFTEGTCYLITAPRHYQENIMAFSFTGTLFTGQIKEIKEKAPFLCQITFRIQDLVH